MASSVARGVQESEGRLQKPTSNEAAMRAYEGRMKAQANVAEFGEVGVSARSPGRWAARIAQEARPLLSLSSDRRLR